MSRREPLALANQNKPATTHKSVFEDLIKHSKEDKIRKAAAVGTGEKTHRAAHARTRPAGGTQDEELLRKVEALQAELDKANARIVRRDETISALKEQAASSKIEAGGAKGMEGKLEELVRKYQSSKDRHHLELSTLQESRVMDSKKIEELKRAHLEAEREIWSLRQTIEDERQRSSSTSTEIERRLRAELEVLMGEREVAEERAEVAEAQVRWTTALYSSKVECSVSKDEFREVQEALWEEQDESASLRTRLAEMESQLYNVREDARDWVARYRMMEEERNELAGMVDSVLEDRQLDRASALAGRILDDSPAPLADTSSTNATVADLVSSHLELVTTHHLDTQNYLEGCIATLVSSLLTAESALVSAQSVHDTLLASHAALQSMHDTVLAQHAPCEGIITGLQTSVTRAEASEGLQKAALFEARREIEAMEDRVRDAKEGVRRANEAVGRSKAAEGALVDEIQELREVLADAQGYQALYEDIRMEHDLLVSREAVMLDEVERVGAQNAELLGPVNGGQKLNYIDGLRREVAAVKHELATTRHRLNTAQDRIVSLTSEVEAYKSIDSPVGGSVLGASGRTKVRRVPEGTAIPGRGLGAKRSMGLLRSASGPVR